MDVFELHLPDGQTLEAEFFAFEEPPPRLEHELARIARRVHLARVLRAADSNHEPYPNELTLTGAPRRPALATGE